MIKFSNAINPEIKSFKRFVIKELLKKGFTRNDKDCHRDLYNLHFNRGDQSFGVIGWRGIGNRCTWGDQQSVTCLITDVVDNKTTIIEALISEDTTIEQFFDSQRDLISKAKEIINSLK